MNEINSFTVDTTGRIPVLFSFGKPVRPDLADRFLVSFFESERPWGSKAELGRPICCLYSDSLLRMAKRGEPLPLIGVNFQGHLDGAAVGKIADLIHEAIDHQASAKIEHEEEALS